MLVMLIIKFAEQTSYKVINMSFECTVVSKYFKPFEFVAVKSSLPENKFYILEVWMIILLKGKVFATKLLNYIRVCFQQHEHITSKKLVQVCFLTSGYVSITNHCQKCVG